MLSCSPKLEDAVTGNSRVNHITPPLFLQLEDAVTGNSPDVLSMMPEFEVGSMVATRNAGATVLQVRTSESLGLTPNPTPEPPCSRSASNTHASLRNLAPSGVNPNLT